MGSLPSGKLLRKINDYKTDKRLVSKWFIFHQLVSAQSLVNNGVLKQISAYRKLVFKIHYSREIIVLEFLSMVVYNYDFPNTGKQHQIFKLMIFWYYLDYDRCLYLKNNNFRSFTLLKYCSSLATTGINSLKSS